MPVYQMIRCGEGFELVIVVSPPDAGPDTPDAKYYCWASWQIGDHQPRMFNEISEDKASSYFSHLADSLGFEDLPPGIFPTLDIAAQYVEGKRYEWAKKWLMGHPIDPEQELRDHISLVEELGREFRHGK